jgi:hypothetical protein
MCTHKTCQDEQVGRLCPPSKRQVYETEKVAPPCARRLHHVCGVWCSVREAPACKEPLTCRSRFQPGDLFFQPAVNGQLPARQLADVSNRQMRIGKGKARDGFFQRLGQAVTSFTQPDNNTDASQKLEVAVEAADIETELSGQPLALARALAEKVQQSIEPNEPVLRDGRTRFGG